MWLHRPHRILSNEVICTECATEAWDNSNYVYVLSKRTSKEFDWCNEFGWANDFQIKPPVRTIIVICATENPNVFCLQIIMHQKDVDKGMVWLKEKFELFSLNLEMSK